VINTDGLGIRYRYGPGVNFITLRIIMDNEVLKVVGTPEVADETTWWRLQDSQGNVGWASQEYLAPAPMPASWNPPLASPTLEASAGTPQP
jgi:hypothetical protein